MIARIILAAALALAAPEFEQHFAPGENLERIDVSLIDSAGETLDVAAFVLTDRPVIEALTDAAARGVRVRLYRWRSEHAPYPEIAAELDAMRAAGVVEKFKPPGAPLMHLKAYCVDGGALRFGAANFSRSGLTAQDNDLEIRRGPHACDAFEATFEQLWSRE